MKRIAAVAVSLIFLSACRPSDKELLERAESAALQQKGQVAKQFYLQIIQKRSRKDEVRLGALQGLAEVSLSQLSDYPTAVSAYEKIIEEFDNEPFFKNRVPEFRFKAARVYRIHLQKLQRAYDVILPVLQKKYSVEIDAAMAEEVGRIHLARREFNEAEKQFIKAFEQISSCKGLSRLQLDLVQTYTLAKNCDRALEWSARPLPGECKRDDYSLAIERARCYEINGDPAKALRIYEEMIVDTPKNSRLHFLRDALKRRMKDKQKR